MVVSISGIVLGTSLATAWTTARPFAAAEPDTAASLGAPQDSLPERLSSDIGPEGRLVKAYHALHDGHFEAAWHTVSALVRDHPEFSLAQLLYGDLLAAQTGQTQVFGMQAHAEPDPADRRASLRDEAMRRWAALQFRPPAGHIPAEFIRLSPDVRHAVAIDASRSRLYVFEQGPQGLTLRQDVYVSVGRQGMGKQVGGDQRTPLGVYWITATFKSPMRDPRLGEAALGINYPNAWDRLLGRTGSGLFLHGVPPGTLAHPPQATDGCVAMSNDEALSLLETLDPNTTPVVISRALSWVPAAQVAGPYGEFLSAHAAWLNARRSGDEAAVRSWYERGSVPLPGRPESQASSPSIIAWRGDDTPLVIVSAAHPTVDDGQPAQWRQYWARREGQWRIFFDGVAPLRRPPALLGRAGAPVSPTSR